jgi:hypothetical protein
MHHAVSRNNAESAIVFHVLQSFCLLGFAVQELPKSNIILILIGFHYFQLDQLLNILRSKSVLMAVSGRLYRNTKYLETGHTYFDLSRQ